MRGEMGVCRTGLVWHLKKHHKVCYWLGGRWRGGGRARGKGVVSYWPILAPQETP